MDDFLRGLNQLSLDNMAAIFREAGIRPHPKVAEFLEKVLNRLQQFHAQADIEALQQAGIAREMVAIVVMGIEMGAACTDLKKTFGGKRARQREQDLLVGPVRFLVRLGEFWGKAADVMPAEMVPSPMVVTKGLQFYADILNQREWNLSVHRREFLIGCSQVCLCRFREAGYGHLP